MSSDRGRLLYRIGLLAVAILAPASLLHAQDTRTVTEPTLPDPNTLCSIQIAQLTSVNGDLTDSDNAVFDTGRIQDALNGCPVGGAVELQPANGNDAFQIQPITIPAGVTLLIDPGATVFASRDPRDYDVASGSCGIIATSSPGCLPLIQLNRANGAAIMGGGTIDGRGGDTLIGQDVTWWDLARQAQQQHLNQFNPRLIQSSNTNNLTLYQITIINAPNMHVVASGGDGLTFWGVTIDTPYGSRNTDGIDPGNATNVTITQSSINDGDDNIAIGAGGAPAANFTISNNHFGGGHGMSIGSFTRHGVSNVSVSNLNISGVAGDHVDTGLRIKSDVSRGGLVQNINYSNVCIRDVYNPLVFDPFYTPSATGSEIPDYQNIFLQNIHVLTPGKLKLEGHDADHPIGLTLDNVIFDQIQSSDITASEANITFGPGPVNLPAFTGTDVSIDNEISNDNPPYACDTVFPGLGPVLTVGGPGGYSRIQDAVDALPPTGGTIKITPNPDPYVEVVRILTPNVKLVGLGSSPSDVVISFNNSAGTLNAAPTPTGAPNARSLRVGVGARQTASGTPAGAELGVAGAATLTARGDGFIAENLTIQNTFDLEHDQDRTPGSQAVAVFVAADKAVFRHVRIIGRRTTLLARSKGCRSGTCSPARQYFYGSVIEGNVDFITGDAAAVFDHCTIRVAPRGPTGQRRTTITAQSKRTDGYLSGFVFINSVVTADPAVTTVYLGRPKTPHSTNVWLDTYLEAPVNPDGWIELEPGTTTYLSSASFHEYRSFGPGAAWAREAYAVPLGAIDSQAWEPNAFLNGTDNWWPTLIY